MNEMNNFMKNMVLQEAKSQLSATIDNLTRKGRKYVSYKTLQKEMDLDDDSFSELINSAQKSNRHSNKYVFTNVEDEPHIGIAASKRKRKAATGDEQSADSGIPTPTPGHGLAHNMAYKERVLGFQDYAAYNDAKKQLRESELWKLIRNEGWRGMDKRGLLPDGWQSMNETQIVKTILEKEFPVNEIEDVADTSASLMSRWNAVKAKVVVGNQIPSEFYDEFLAELKLRNLRYTASFPITYAEGVIDARDMEDDGMDDGMLPVGITLDDATNLTLTWSILILAALQEKQMLKDIYGYASKSQREFRKILARANVIHVYFGPQKITLKKYLADQGITLDANGEIL